MMRGLLDRMQCMLPSRAGIVRYGLYFAFGLALYALFLGLFHFRGRCEAELRRMAESQQVIRMSMSRPQMSFFPPSLSIASLSVQPRTAVEPILLNGIRVRLTVFPPGAALSAGVAGGRLAATVIPSSVRNPEHISVGATVSGADAAELLRSFTEKGSPVSLGKGSLEGRAAADIPLKNGRPDMGSGSGQMSLRLHDGTLESALPLLKTGRLEQLAGTLDGSWKREKMDVKTFELRNASVAVDMKGVVTLANDPSLSRMDMQAVLRADPDVLQQGLIPGPALQVFRDKGELRFRLHETFRRPAFDVQP